MVWVPPYDICISPAYVSSGLIRYGELGRHGARRTAIGSAPISNRIVITDKLIESTKIRFFGCEIDWMIRLLVWSLLGN